MSIARKIARKQAWQELPSEARRRENRHPNFDVYGIAKSMTRNCFMKAAYANESGCAIKSGKIANAQSGEDLYDSVERVTRRITTG